VTVDTARAPTTAHPHPAWPLMLAHARALGWPRSFPADLQEYDRAALRRADPCTRFVWAIGETGTTLVWVGRPNDRRYDIDRARSLATTFAEERPRMFAWDGVALHSIDRDRCVAFLTERDDE
jgi:hypothetical protein